MRHESALLFSGGFVSSQPMISKLRVIFTASMALLFTTSSYAEPKSKIVLIAGTVKKNDRVGHHDYSGGVRMIKHLLDQNPQLETEVIFEGWPADESIFDDAKAVVFYTDGGGKQAYLQTPERIAAVQRMIDAGVGLVSIHQAVEFPAKHYSLAAAWVGGLYQPVISGRGHWDSSHDSFPQHEITRGVSAWKINDGWLNGFKFPTKMKGVAPLVYSGKIHQGSSEGGSKDIVAWAFERADGGRSFNYSGLDAHDSWERDGVRQLMVNGIVWAAGIPVPEGGAKSEADKAIVDSFLTPRIAPAPKKKK
jgi:hypothetical protein